MRVELTFSTNNTQVGMIFLGIAAKHIQEMNKKPLLLSTNSTIFQWGRGNKEVLHGKCQAAPYTAVCIYTSILYH